MRCSICNADSLQEIAKIDGYRETTSYIVSECGTCGTSSVQPCEMDARIYQAIYEHVKDVPGYSRYYALAGEIVRQADPLSYIANLEEPYFAVVDSIKSQFAKVENLLICELGCGQGYFTFALRKAGFNATGVDHSQEAVAMARKRYGDFYFCGDLTEYIDQIPERPHVIFACEVIEHLVDPVRFVSMALSCLPRGGLLAITTPNKLQHADDSSRRIIWDTELPPVHLWWFTKRSFMEIAKRVDCSVEFSNFTEFYAVNEQPLARGGGASAVRSPILDKNYNLIQFASSGQGLAPFKTALSALLPATATKALRRFRASRGSEIRYRDDATSSTIGALFRKK